MQSPSERFVEFVFSHQIKNFCNRKYPAVQFLVVQFVIFVSTKPNGKKAVWIPETDLSYDPRSLKKADLPSVK